MAVCFFVSQQTCAHGANIFPNKLASPQVLEDVFGNDCAYGRDRELATVKASAGLPTDFKCPDDVDRSASVILGQRSFRQNIIVFFGKGDFGNGVPNDDIHTRDHGGLLAFFHSS